MAQASFRTVASKFRRGIDAVADADALNDCYSARNKRAGDKYTPSRRLTCHVALTYDCVRTDRTRTLLFEVSPVYPMTSLATLLDVAACSILTCEMQHAACDVQHSPFMGARAPFLLILCGSNAAWPPTSTMQWRRVIGIRVIGTLGRPAKPLSHVYAPTTHRR